jgi:NAD(P)H-hydrate epimerase
MAGAVALAGMACLRSGAGLVKLAVPECILETVAGFEPSYMTVPLACDQDGRIAARHPHGQATYEQLEPFVEWATCIAVGPGLGRSQALSQLVDWLNGRARCCLVIDADGLHAWSQRSQPKSSGPRIITPHPGEWQQFSESRSKDRQVQVTEAKQVAGLVGSRLGQTLVVVLKGRETYITDGQREALNTTGNPGMATGGTGDVLTGVITALVCQGLSPFDAAVLGAHVHGLAGDLAAAELGQVSLIASDLLRFLSRAFQQLPAHSSP